MLSNIIVRMHKMDIVWMIREISKIPVFKGQYLVLHLRFAWCIIFA